jgi:hypothetical protein
MQPPQARTLEKLLRELEEAIERDKRFIAESDWLLFKWRCISHAMNKRVREVLRTRTPDESNSS